jgi:hypothetical protein
MSALPFALFGAPRRGAVLWVEVPPRGGHPNRSKPQLRKGDRPWEGSGERNRRPMYKNRMRGGAERGERANDREAPMTKAQATYIRRSCGEGQRSYRGRSRLMLERATLRSGARSQPRS